MAKVVLHSDLTYKSHLSPGGPSAQLVQLPGDLPYVKTDVNPVVTVKSRSRTGWSADGDPEYAWSKIVTDRAIMWVDETELDEIAGTTHVVATVVVAYSGDQVVGESCVVETPSGKYRCSKVSQFEDRLEMRLHRIEDLDVEPEATDGF